MVSPHNNGLGDFLRARRAGLNPDETGIPLFRTDRRVPGLRREEVALLAGVSVNYYARLEQGAGHQMSDSVLEAIAAALRLDEDERQHLARLAWPTQSAFKDPGPEAVRNSLRTLVELNTSQAAAVIGRNTDLLAANKLFFSLFGLRAGQRVNMARHIFLEPAMRERMADWEAVASDVAGYLRLATGERRNDPELAALTGELNATNAQFARVWATHPVADCSNTVQHFNHPRVGRLTLVGESLRVPNAPGQRINFLTAEPDSDSADRFRTLASLVQ